MTPFDSWYAANVEPNLPKDFPPQLAKAGKAEAAKVWNAAIEKAASSDVHIDFIIPAECTPRVADACIQGVQRAMRAAIRWLRVSP